MDERKTYGAGLWEMPGHAYHRDPAPRPSLSSTIARILLAQSMLHAWTASPRLNPDHEPTEKKVFDFGRAAHRCVLGKGDEYAAIPEELLGKSGAASTNAAKAWIEDARARGVTPLKAEEVDQIDTMADRCRARLAQMKMVLDPARSELVGIAEIGGVWNRSMFDNAPEGKKYLIDFKTTTDASPEACMRAVCNYGYDVQARHYLDVWEAVTGEKRSMRFVFQEKTAPYEVSVVELMDDPAADGDWMLDAASKVAEARFLWRRGLDTGEWPGYPAKIARVEAPVWHRRSWADRAVQHAAEPKPNPEAIRRATAWQSPEGMTA